MIKNTEEGASMRLMTTTDARIGSPQATKDVEFVGSTMIK